MVEGMVAAREEEKMVVVGKEDAGRVAGMMEVEKGMESMVGAA